MTEKHSPLPWAVQPFADTSEGIGIISLRDGSDNPSNGVVAIAALFPTEIEANDPSRAQANAALIVRAVNGLPEAIAALEAAKVLLLNSRHAVERLHGHKSGDAFRTIDVQIDAALTKLKG